MSEQPDPVREVLRWVEQAEHDLLAAEHTMQLAESAFDLRGRSGILE